MKCAIDGCMNEVKVAETGRPGKFCSKACKQKDYRLKQKNVTERKRQTPVMPSKQLLDLEVNKDEGVVYGLLDPRDQQFYYIGMSIDVYARFKQHISCQGDNENKNRWVQELKSEGLRPHLVIIETSKDMCRIKLRESYWIQYYIQSMHPLLNKAETKDARGSLVTMGVTKLPDIRFYCGLNEKYWNHHTVEPGEYVCIAPVTISTEEDKKKSEEAGELKKRKVLRKTQVLIDDTKVRCILLDSGAFSDGIELKDGKVVENKRLSFENALKRQIAHAYEFRYDHLVEGIVSYDLLIDETWEDGERSKERWSVESAEFAVNETIQAARYLASQRIRINHAFGHHVNLVLSAQGVNAEQYRRCAEEIVKLMKPDDVFGLGGWCITGLMRHKMLPAAADMLPGVFEVLGHANVKRVHVFGVIIPKLLGFLLHSCDLYGIELSTDSAGPCVEPARNSRWGYGSWTNPAYRSPATLPSCRVLDEQGNKAPTCPPETRCKGLDRVRHVQLTREWLANFRIREADLIASIPVPECKQLFLLEEIA